jgi:hypothetical protein
MSRFWLARSGGSWTARAAAILVIALAAGFTMAQQSRSGGGGAPPASAPLVAALPTASVAPLESVFERYRARARERSVLEVDLDDLTNQLGSSRRRTVLDREALARVIQAALGTDASVEPVEEVRLGDLLDRYPRVRISTEGRSVVLGRLALTALARRVVGRGPRIEDVTLGELMDALPPVTLGPDGVPENLGASAGGGLESLFGQIQKVDQPEDPRRLERRDIEQRYENVSRLVNRLRREGFVERGDPNAVYDEAYRQLLAAGEDDSVPLLDGHLQLESEIANADLSGMGRAERIQFRWQARRYAFGDEMAAILFSRQEAMERYQVDALALESDDYSSPRDKARALADRRMRLKVELAAQGSYVAFPDEAQLQEPGSPTGDGGAPEAGGAPAHRRTREGRAR